MATKAQLKHLRIKQFRGSTKDFSLTFDASKPLTLIYGENGSGKTTIADAIDFVGNGRVGSLEGRGLGIPCTNPRLMCLQGPEAQTIQT